MDQQTVLVAERDGIVEITLNRPDARNAFNQQLVRELTEAFERVLDGPAGQVVILTGAGPSFCSGADLKEAREGTAEDYRRRTRHSQRVLELIENLPVPTIAAINGPAVGGGLEVAAACDLRIAAATARMGYVEVRVGVAALSRRILSLIGPGRAKDLYYTAELVDAARAETMGLVNRVVPPEDLMPAAREWAATIQRGMPLALRYTKALINLRSKPAQEEACRALAEEAAVACAATEDRQEALAAFAERRRPVWRGR